MENMETSEQIMTNMDVVIYNVINSEPIIFDNINDISIIMSIIIDINPLRIKNAIFKTNNGKIYCSSNDKTYNIVIPKEMIESFITILINGENKIKKDIIFNIYYPGVELEFLACLNTQELFKGIEDRFVDVTNITVDNFSHIENFKISQTFESCLLAMINNEPLNKLLIISKKNSSSIYAEYSKETNTLIYYYKPNFSAATQLILGCRLIESGFKKIQVVCHSCILIARKC